MGAGQGITFDRRLAPIDCRRSTGSRWLVVSSSGGSMTSNAFFIASSTEGRDHVDDVTSIVEAAGGKAVDWATYFEPGDFVLEKLLGAASRVSMAIIVVTPDDMLQTRDETHLTPRDNIILEIGLFAGRLGIRSVAIVVCPTADGKLPKLPSDLAGLIYLTYDGNVAKSRITLKRQFEQMIARAENFRVYHELRDSLDMNREHLAEIENELSEKYILNKFREIANHARTREVIVQPDEYYSELYRAMDTAGPETSILAVSTFSPQVWTEQPDQQIYLQKNLEAADRGAKIRRIFLQTEAQVGEISSEIAIQLKKNISIRRAPAHISGLTAALEDFVMFLDEKTGKGRIFVADPSPLNPAQIRRGRIVQDYRDRIWMRERFENIWQVSPALRNSSDLEAIVTVPPPKLETRALAAPVVSCEQAANAKGIELQRELKSIVVQTRMGCIAVHTRGDRDVSLRKVKRELGLKEAYLASPEVLQKMGLEPGTVSAVRDPVWSMLNLITKQVLDLDLVSTNDGTLTNYVLFDPQILTTNPRHQVGDFEEDVE